MTARLRGDDLVTGEAVVVVLPVAGPAIRLLSGLLDVLTIMVISFLTFWTGATLFGALDSQGLTLDDAFLTGLAVLLQVALLVGVPVTLETLTGRTVGKMICGLRTVRDDGAPADLRRVLVRHLVAAVEVWGTGASLYVIALLFTRPTRRLGDMAAGTYVARDRIRLQPPPPRPMPAGLEAWAATADVGRVPDDVAAIARAFRSQEAQFTPDAAARVLDDLVTRMSSSVAPPPPAGTSPSDFLDAVMAERRRRDTLRLEAETRRRDRLFPRPDPLAVPLEGSDPRTS